jgi:hypothetical protein
VAVAVGLRTRRYRICRHHGGYTSHAVGEELTSVHHLFSCLKLLQQNLTAIT